MKPIIIPGQIWTNKYEDKKLVVYVEPTCITLLSKSIIYYKKLHVFIRSYKLTSEVDWTYVRPDTVVTINGLSGMYSFEGCVKRSGRIILSLGGCPGWQPEELCSLYYEPEAQPEPEPEKEKAMPEIKAGQIWTYKQSEQDWEVISVCTCGSIRLKMVGADEYFIFEKGVFLGSFDFKPTKHKRTVWLNYAADGLAEVWDDVEAAHKNAHPDRIACLKLDLEFAEGEGL